MSKDILFTLFHQVDALKAKIRQMVAIEHATPPSGSTIEDFPNLSVKEASELIKRQSSGVPLSAWPTRDQRLMKEGKMPVLGDHPEHPNV